MGMGISTMSSLKTSLTKTNVQSFIDNIKHPTRRQDSQTLLELYASVTQKTPQMWGENMVGFGEYTYVNSNGKTYKWFRCGFSPRKQYMSLYIMAGVKQHPELLEKLGKHKHGVSCLNINKLSDVNLDIVKRLIENDITVMDSKYP